MSSRNIHFLGGILAVIIIIGGDGSGRSDLEIIPILVDLMIRNRASILERLLILIKKLSLDDLNCYQEMLKPFLKLNLYSSTNEFMKILPI